MQTSFHLLLVAVIDGNGKESVKVISKREAKRFMSKKANRKYISKQIIKQLKVNVSVNAINY